MSKSAAAAKKRAAKKPVARSVEREAHILYGTGYEEIRAALDALEHISPSLDVRQLRQLIKTQVPRIRRTVTALARVAPYKGIRAPMNEDHWAIYLMSRGSEALESGNRAKTSKAERRRVRIAELYDEYRKQNPHGRSAARVQEYIIEKLTAEGFVTSKKSGVTPENLAGRDLPLLRALGWVEQKHTVPYAGPPTRPAR